MANLSRPGRLRRALGRALFSLSPRIAQGLGVRFRYDSADRRFLEGPVFEFLNLCYRGRHARCLFIGMSRYNWHYPRLLGLDFHSVDIDPRCARFGQPGRHVTGDATALRDHYPASHFDVVIANGMVGYGVDDAEAFGRLLHGAIDVLRPGGRLILGYNDTPRRLGFDMALALEGCGLAPEAPPILGLDGHTVRFPAPGCHRYVFLRKPRG
ncbi:class I SAM-dependent methyltransferase [Bordetella pseudohinzii]|uniref:Methyltransferase domain n=1 Tax=Bordetella pseudohinzii TaxID=1331258 RepID=A0A0J6C2E1_9BORD|nr:class I SAM-dependent methyltransferase [Bordetella pseudohinzii]ANY15945.1 hypothetical protein BBN53_08575 [Bordetella pseudohinzii]KMM25183.1 hypothetical protein L540_03055 [Bordetella pseudohinzii]KXA76181.1 hypothetical protein AW877_17645 [Bordetella pseudohinzii]KXA78949.1 hypothetical protein AW878_11360 [Bordetella pseudohinzii]CUI45734.1 Uncharacterised protein [Bordetella pseudohinzii]